MIPTQPQMIIVAAPSGSGKTTLVQAMLARFEGFAFSISATTRSPRPNEVHGRDYYFLSRAEFEQRRDAGDFLEWEEVYDGRYYGTLRSEVDRILSAGQVPLFDIDVEGAANLKAQFGDRALSVFIQPPSPEALLTRLQARGTDSPEEVARRYAKARQELAYAPRFDYILVNDDLEAAKAELFALVATRLGVAARL